MLSAYWLVPLCWINRGLLYRMRKPSMQVRVALGTVRAARTTPPTTVNGNGLSYFGKLTRVRIQLGRFSYQPVTCYK